LRWLGFNPRPPRGGRPWRPEIDGNKCVSIRAPRAGGDRTAARPGRTGRFNPRPPRGGRPLQCNGITLSGCEPCFREPS
jgi:hypothetical protein